MADMASHLDILRHVLIDDDVTSDDSHDRCLSVGVDDDIIDKGEHIGVYSMTINVDSARNL